MATIDDDRARLVVGQAERLRNDARKADELLRQGKIDEARELVARNVSYANAIWHELDLLTRPPPEIPIRGSRGGAEGDTGKRRSGRAMRRDMDLIRELLLAIESRSLRGPDAEGPGVAVEGYDASVIAYHLVLLHEASLIQASVADAFGMEYPEVFVDRLTWQGHEFLDAARNQTVWTRTKAIVREKGGDIPFSVLRELLIGAARQVFGLG